LTNIRWQVVWACFDARAGKNISFNGCGLDLSGSAKGAMAGSV
jgi:hypothetical protein